MSGIQFWQLIFCQGSTKTVTTPIDCAHVQQSYLFKGRDWQPAALQAFLVGPPTLTVDWH